MEVRRLEPNQISEKEDFISFKIIIVGNSGVGKSSLLKKAVIDKFKEDYHPTIGFELQLIYYKINGKKIKLQIWDTCGQEMYRSLIQGFYRNSSLALLTYSITDQKSFDDLSEWVKEIKNNSEEKISIFVVGNKYDLSNELRIIKREDGEQFVKNLAYNFLMKSQQKQDIM